MKKAEATSPKLPAEINLLGGFVCVLVNIARLEEVVRIPDNLEIGAAKLGTTQS